mmetsp:Transcript_48381/g.89081  ORF Transcript_48381/g.89081 Transcript_48381/m.89081 type:complete len:198 (-) Transcript_48381:61-654(-)
MSSVVTAVETEIRRRQHPSLAVGSAEAELPSNAATRTSECSSIYGEAVLPKPQARMMFALSWLSLASCCLALARGHYDLACAPGGVWLTSINHWRNPMSKSWRRYIDISYVYAACSYQGLRAYGAANANQYYSAIATGILFFILSSIVHEKLPDFRWCSALLHAMVHVMGNLGNVLLYTGDVQSLEASLASLPFAMA